MTAKYPEAELVKVTADNCQLQEKEKIRRRRRGIEIRGKRSKEMQAM